MFGGLGVVEIVLILLLLLLLFGARRIPLIARGIGEGIRNFKTGIADRERIEDPDSSNGDDIDRRS